MIKANELRIGNWILINGAHYGKVVSIEESRFATYNPCNRYTDGTTGDYWRYDTDYVNPIPLTPEILESCGFKKEFDNVYSNKQKVKDSDLYTLPFALFYHKNQCYHTSDFSRRNNFKPFRYLHQLQNLYFWLTGEELEFTQQPATIHSQN